jgi:hypothetical protein
MLLVNYKRSGGGFLGRGKNWVREYNSDEELEWVNRQKGDIRRSNQPAQCLSPRLTEKVVIGNTRVAVCRREMQNGVSPGGTSAVFRLQPRR